MTQDQIKDWLKSIGQNRQWLAEQLHATKGTIDQWFSRGFPDDKLAMIEMVSQARGTGGLDVSFTPAEWREIQTAMNHAGYSSQTSFFHDGIMCYSHQLQDSKSGRILSRAPIDEIAMVSEPAVTYKAGKPAKPKKRTNFYEPIIPKEEPSQASDAQQSNRGRA